MHGKISFLEPMNYFLFHTKNGNQNPKLSDHFAFFWLIDCRGWNSSRSRTGISLFTAYPILNFKFGIDNLLLKDKAADTKIFVSITA